MRSVFAMTVAATLVVANSVAAQTTSAPGCGTCAERSRHWRSGLGANAWNAIAWWGHADALAINQQHSLAKQRRPLSAHPSSTQSGTERPVA